MSKLNEFIQKMECKKLWVRFKSTPKGVQFGVIAIMAVLVLVAILVAAVPSHHDKATTLNHHGKPSKSAFIKHNPLQPDAMSKGNDRAALLKAVYVNQKAIQELSLEMRLLDRHVSALQKAFSQKEPRDQSILAIKRDITNSIARANALNAEHINDIQSSINAFSNNITKALKATQGRVIPQLDPKTLPFVVVDAEWWNGVHKIRIKDKKTGQYHLIDVGTNYQGWVLSKVSGQAPITFTFVNPKGQSVEVI